MFFFHFVSYWYSVKNILLVVLAFFYQNNATDTLCNLATMLPARCLQFEGTVGECCLVAFFTNTSNFFFVFRTICFVKTQAGKF